MIAEFEKFHGVALRELIVSSEAPVSLERATQTGRIHSYVLNRAVGIHIKHSSKRLPPWQFTFTRDQMNELTELKTQAISIWLLLICGSDGIVALTDREFDDVTGDILNGTPFVRIDRDPRRMYRVFGSAGQLPGAKASGVSDVLKDVVALASNGGAISPAILASPKRL